MTSLCVSSSVFSVFFSSLHDPYLCHEQCLQTCFSTAASDSVYKNTVVYDEHDRKVLRPGGLSHG